MQVLVEVTVIGENAAPHRNPIMPAPRSPKIKPIMRVFEAPEAMHVTGVTFTFSFSVPVFPKVSLTFRGVWKAYNRFNILALERGCR